MKAEIISKLDELIAIAEMPSDEFIKYWMERYPNSDIRELEKYPYAAKVGHIAGKLTILRNHIEVVME